LLYRCVLSLFKFGDTFLEHGDLVTQCLNAFDHIDMPIAEPSDFGTGTPAMLTHDDTFKRWCYRPTHHPS
jgi:hypothetical protein